MAFSIGYVVSEMNVWSPTRFGQNVHCGGWGVYGLQESLRHLGVSAEALDDRAIDGESDLSRFKLLILPDMPIVTARRRERLEGFVRNGGVALVDGIFGLFRDASLTPWRQERTGYVDELFGFEVKANQVADKFDASEPIIAGFIRHEYMGAPVFRGLPRELPAFGRTRVVNAAAGGSPIGQFSAAALKGAIGQELDGAFLTFKRFGQGMAVYLAARLFRSVGLLLSSFTDLTYWVSRTEYFPSADSSGGVHGWEHSAFCRALRQAGLGDFSLVEYLDRLLSNILEWIDAETGSCTPRVWFYPEGRELAFTLTWDVDHATEGKTWFFDEWRELLRELGVASRSTWLFEAHSGNMDDYPHTSLSEYRITDEPIREVARELRSEGYEVDLHHCHFEGDVIADEVRRFEQALGWKPHGTRGHYLVDSPAMLKAIEDAGLLWDSSWFNHQEIASMSGVYHPYHPFDPDRKEAMNILELPAFFTDGMQWWDMYGLAPPLGYEALAERMERMRWVNGVWVTGFHSNYAPRRADNLNFIITLAKDKNAWIVPAGELADWWRLRETMRLGIERKRDTQVVTVKTEEGTRAFPGVTITLNGLPPRDTQVKLNGKPAQATFRESPCQWPRHFVRLDDGKPEQVIELDVASG